ncbi:cation:proton antiporter [Idiomarina aminovorans]|uniref:cation:proton antiporter n=1 Tax=Idiomarina aminovorans TaxID=2914829 RepID=UPI002003B8A9|nr:cation:proton antiporter [Idiomarina sp. ATCH4]MCK7458649.1 cation:proton antiporter [Idiomarina sp. ATCH4]
MEAIIHSSPFYELAALLALAALIGIIGQWLRQPMVVCFIAVGIIAGPSVLDLVQSHENIEILAELGIAVLLFLVGLKLDVKLIKTLGIVSLATGLGQVAFTALIGFGLSLLLGLSPLSSLYVAVALTFSSTIIIVKLLSDKREVDSLHGKVAIGFLIVQDLAVVLAMVVLSSMGIGESEDTGVTAVLQVLFNAAVMLGLVLLFIRYIAEPLVSRVAKSSELLVTFTIAWAGLLAALGHYFGFSMELGGLLAGVALASTPFRESIVARLAPLRDFLLLFFFIALGTQLDLSLLGQQFWPAMVLSLFVLVGNPLIVMIIMGIMGFRRRTGFLAGLTVAQISEFSLIFVAMGITIGHVGKSELGLVTLVGLITIALSVYMITYSHRLYSWLEPLLGIFERKIPYREQQAPDIELAADFYDVVVVGLGRYGRNMTHYLKQKELKVLAVDFDPERVKELKRQGQHAIYGDVSDAEFVSHMPLGAAWVIGAMPQHDIGVTHEDPRITLIQGLKERGYTGKVAVPANNFDDVKDLHKRGADLVLFPFKDAAEQAVNSIIEFEQIKKDKNSG